MFGVLLLVACEKIINTAISTDSVTQNGLKPLSGRTLRVVLREPAVQIDVLFNDTHIRFEPVTQSIFEPKGGMTVAEPNCTLTVANISELCTIMATPNMDLPINGDKDVAYQTQQLIAGFDPDVIGKLQPIIGLPLASQLANIIGGIRQNFAKPSQNSFYQDQQTYEQLKQQLHNLQLEIAQQQEKLDKIKSEQQQLRESGT